MHAARLVRLELQHTSRVVAEADDDGRHAGKEGLEPELELLVTLEALQIPD